MRSAKLELEVDTEVREPVIPPDVKRARRIDSMVERLERGICRVYD